MEFAPGNNGKMVAQGISAADISAVSNPEDVEEILNRIEALEKHRMECDQQGRYDEADLAKTMLQQLSDEMESRRREQLRTQQLNDRLGVEEAHMHELQEFNEIWDRKIAEFEAHAANLSGTLSARHNHEYRDSMEKYRLETEPKTPRWSRDLLNLRKIQETLAKQKNYAEAKKTKDHADTMEQKEHNAWKSKRDRKIATLEEQYLRKQELEMGGLLKRIASGREEQQQARKTELSRLLQRYHNVKTQQESQHTIILQRSAKFPLPSPVGMSVSRPPSRISSSRSVGTPARQAERQIR